MEMKRSNFVTLVVGLLMAYATYFVARVAYLLENWSTFGESDLVQIFRGGVVFDTPAILYTNSLWIVLLLLPLHLKERRGFHRFLRGLYVAVNVLMLAVNLADSVYFRFTMRRTTATVFSEFSSEENLASIFGVEIVRHWYFVLLAAAVGYALWRLYVMPRRPQNLAAYYAVQVVGLLVVVPLSIAGIRGGFSTAVRPITISNARQYAERPTDAALVLNTPFSVIRTIGKDVFEVPTYFASEEELATAYNPIHGERMRNEERGEGSENSFGNEGSEVNVQGISHSSLPTPHTSFKNIVILIVESFGREYIGALNPPGYKGYTPCVDSIIGRSITFSRSYCNGRKSIDAMPSILSGIPMFVEPFVLTPASMNKVEGIASLLGRKGYSSAFFHGAQRGSMGFQAFAKSVGFQDYYGREDYEADSRFGGHSDFDGTWAIWDEPFLQYYCAKMGEMREPFVTAVFTASSHHPYRVPEELASVYPEEGIIIHKCIRYTDHAIGRFFQEASRQPWFENTIFVITSDHTNLSDHAYYQTDLGGFCSPVIIYEPSLMRSESLMGSEERGVRSENGIGNGENMQSMSHSPLPTPHSPLRYHPPLIIDAIAQQTDILPTLLGMVGFDEPFLAFGCDLFRTPPEQTYAVNYLNGIYQYVKNGYLLQFDGQQTRAVYALTDSAMRRNLVGRVPVQQQMERELKGIIQQYMERMTQDRLTP